MISYRAILDVPRELVSYLSRLLRTERRERGTRRRTRRLTPWWQAVLGLTWFRNGGDIPNLGRGFDLSRSTSYRYLDEVIDVLAEQAPELKDALERARTGGLPHLIIDGTLTSIDQVGEKKTSAKGKQIDAWYSGKARAFAANLQGLMQPGGFPIWISGALPGSTHDITAARDDRAAGGDGRPADRAGRRAGAQTGPQLRELLVTAVQRHLRPAGEEAAGQEWEEAGPPAGRARRGPGHGRDPRTRSKSTSRTRAAVAERRCRRPTASASRGVRSATFPWSP